MDLLTPATGLVFWQTIIFLGLVFLLAKFAWKPILQSLKDREESIKTALESAEKAKQEMTALQSTNEKLLREARDERDKILRDAKTAANRVVETAHEEAKKSANKIMEEAKTAIEAEKTAALREVKNEMARFSVQIAEKIVRQNLANDKAQTELAEKLVKEIHPN